MITDEELFAKADRWLNDPQRQNYKTNSASIGFVSSLMLQVRRGKNLSEKQKDYMYAILVRCYDEPRQA